MWYLHIHFVRDRLFAWFAMVVAFPGRCVLNKRIFTPFGGRPRARAEPSTRTRIAGGFCGRAQRGHRLMSLQQDTATQMAAVSMAIYGKPSC